MTWGGDPKRSDLSPAPVGLRADAAPLSTAGNPAVYVLGGMLIDPTAAAQGLEALNSNRGAPVSEYTVAEEMGHGGTSLVRRVYGHLGQIRHRSEFVEYRVEQHREELEDGLTLMRRAIAAETKREQEKAARRREKSASVSDNAGRFEPTLADAKPVQST